MLSTNSLAAFSAATTTVQPHRPASTASSIRLVREPQLGGGPGAGLDGGPVKNALPQKLPSVPPPRGSLLNLSV